MLRLPASNKQHQEVKSKQRQAHVPQHGSIQHQKVDVTSSHSPERADARYATNLILPNVLQCRQCTTNMTAAVCSAEACFLHGCTPYATRHLISS